MIGFHLRTSLQMALMYGNLGLSSRVGRECVPITLSSSSCPFFSASGYKTMARKNVNKEANVYKGNMYHEVSLMDSRNGPYRHQLDDFNRYSTCVV